MKEIKVKVSQKGFKLGDFVLFNNYKFGRILEINQWVYDETDSYVKRGLAKVGDPSRRYAYLTIQTIVGVGFEKVKRKSTSMVYEYQISCKVDKAFVKKIFKTLNDTIVYVKMINEQEGITNE